MTSRTHIPRRMCVGCRARHPAPGLLRLQRRPDGRVVSGRGGSGRSAYVCPSKVCYEKALKRRAFTRALAGPKGLSVACDGSTLWSDIGQNVAMQVEQLRRTSGGPSGPRGRLNELVGLAKRLDEANEGVPNGQGSCL